MRSVEVSQRRLRVWEAVSEANGHLVWSTPTTHHSHQSRVSPSRRSLLDALAKQAASKKPDVLFRCPNGELIRLTNWHRQWDPGGGRRGPDQG